VAAHSAHPQAEADVVRDRQVRKKQRLLEDQPDRSALRGKPEMLRPSKWMSPMSGAVRPASIDRVVLFPHPEGPSRAVNEPAASSTLR